MKIIAVAPTQQELNELLNQARIEDVMLEAADGKQFIVSAVDDADLEIIRIRQYAGGSPVMKTINVPADAEEINTLLDQARCDDLVLRSADGTQFLLVEDFEDEVRRTLNNKDLMALLDARWREPATITLEELKQELGLR